MKILGISLGHDTNFCLVEDGEVIAVMEAERFFRKKHYKLQATHIRKGKHPSGFQYIDIEELKLFLNRIKEEWGDTYDYIAVQNQQRGDEFFNLCYLLSECGFLYNEIKNFDHHFSHACGSYFTSPFDEAVVLSFDGAGNDGFTLFFKCQGSEVKLLKSINIRFGSAYNNFGYLCGVSPDNSGTSSGKTMGLASYGSNIEDWAPFFQEHIINYTKKPYQPFEGLNDYGKGHTRNWDHLESIPAQLGMEGADFQNLTPRDGVAQDIAATAQSNWSFLVLKLLYFYGDSTRNICLTGGCALNGTTNYKVQQSGFFDNFHFVPNPSDCGLSVGAALAYYYEISGDSFKGKPNYLCPYLGEHAYDLDELETFKNNYPHKVVDESETARIVSELICKDKIVGVIRGRYEIGPRALGNRSILCNSQNKNMRDIINQKVKHREWYRPFAPVCTDEDADRYFTNDGPLPYMSTICYTKEEYRDILPSVTHTDGSARLQTISESQNAFLHSVLKNIEKINDYPICLNTSFNPKGEPILNYCAAGLEMLKTTELDYVVIEDTIFWTKEPNAI